jgi:hypothetical protein
MHTHNFKATDIPGVCLCRCGVERYYARELQTYITVGEGEYMGYYDGDAVEQSPAQRD